MWVDRQYDRRLKPTGAAGFVVEALYNAANLPGGGFMQKKAFIQILFFESDEEVRDPAYSDRGGKYQDQKGLDAGKTVRRFLVFSRLITASAIDRQSTSAFCGASDGFTTLIRPKTKDSNFNKRVADPHRSVRNASQARSGPLQLSEGHPGVRRLLWARAGSAALGRSRGIDLGVYGSVRRWSSRIAVLLLKHKHLHGPERGWMRTSVRVMDRM